MKKVLLTLCLFCFFVAPLFASYPYEFTIADETEIISDDTYSLDLYTGRIVDYLSFQAIYSTETYSASTYDDGQRATGTITILTVSDVAGSTVTVNSLNFIEGRDYSYDATFTSTTATNLYAILASSFSGVISFSDPVGGNVIYATSSVIGPWANYSFSSTVSSIAVVSMTGGRDTDISGTNNTIATTNDFIDGLAVLLSSSSGTNKYSGLAVDTTYYAIPVSATSIKLATTKANAIAGTAIDISSATTPGSGHFTLTPVTIQGSSAFSFKWQASNDKTNWYDISATSITILGTTTPTNYMWDFGMTVYRYIRAKLIAGGAGSVRLKLIGYGKRVAP